jgi:SnoaL-like domain
VSLPDTTTPALVAQRLAQSWTDLWNGDLDLAGALVTGDFRVHFGSGTDPVSPGDAVRGPAQLAAYIGEFREQRPGLRYQLDAPAIADESGFAIRWSAQRTGVDVSGIDVVRVSEGRIAEVWSLTAGRRFPA